MAEFDLGLDALLRSISDGHEAVTSGRIFLQPLNYIGNKAVSYAKLLTMVKSGRLRRGWAFKVNPDFKSITLYNDVEYAKAVNDGHKQEVGRYVPAIGKKLKAPMVRGQHMLQKAHIQVRNNDMAKAQRMVLDELAKEMGWK